MKNLIAFLCGMVVTFYIFPATPEHVLSDMEKREIAYEVIEWLEDADFQALQARRNIVKNKKESWF